MKIEVNLNRKFLFIIGGILVLAWVFVFVGAFGGTTPSSVGHTTGEVDWSTEINSIKVKELDFSGGNTGGSFKIRDTVFGADRLVIDNLGNVDIGNNLNVNSLSVRAGRSFCNSVDTGAGAGDSHQGQQALSLLNIDGVNICIDLEGCTYNIIKYKRNNPGPFDTAAANQGFVGKSRLVYRQSEFLNEWRAATTNSWNAGVNGGGNPIRQVINEEFSQGKLLDDTSAGTQNADNWIVDDSDSSFSYIFTVCDF